MSSIITLAILTRQTFHHTIPQCSQVMELTQIVGLNLIWH